MLRDMLLQMWERLNEAIRRQVQERDGEAPPIERGRRRKSRRLYLYNPREDRPRRYAVQLGVLALGAVFLYSAVSLIGYGVDYAKSRSAAKHLREVYYEELERDAAATDKPTVEPTLAPSPTPQPIPVSTPVMVVKATAQPTATPEARLEKVKYPANRTLQVSGRFKTLRQQNRDIVGWVSIEGLLDEVVVQRDNAYYLNRDYRGYHNINGAVFLDESCDLRTRPYTMILYGHNMKTGAMFGNLRKLENIVNYRKDPFISFDTMYEDGRYVVFSVGTISTLSSNWRFLNFSWLVSSSIALREKAIDQLNRFSVYTNPIDVRPEDQILLLVTCVEDDAERRVVAARRLRDGETEESLLQQIKLVRTK